MANYKLGEQASVYYDPASKLKVLPGQVIAYDGEKTRHMDVAIKNGHIVEVKEEADLDYKSTGAFVENQDEDTEDVDVNKMTNDQLVEYYQANFEVNEDDVATFKKLNKKDKLAFLAS